MSVSIHSFLAGFGPRLWPKGGGSGSVGSESRTAEAEYLHPAPSNTVCPARRKWWLYVKVWFVVCAKDVNDCICISAWVRLCGLCILYNAQCIFKTELLVGGTSKHYICSSVFVCVSECVCVCVCVFSSLLRDDYDTEESPLTDEDERPLTQEELRQRILKGVSDAIQVTYSHIFIRLLRKSNLLVMLCCCYHDSFSVP